MRWSELRKLSRAGCPRVVRATFPVTKSFNIRSTLLALFFTSCNVVAVEPVSPTGPNLLDTLPREQPSGMIPVREMEKRGVVSYEGNIEAVRPGDRMVVVQGWILPRRITDPRPAPKPYNFTVLPNTKITRSGRAISLKDLKRGEHLNILAQPAFDGRFLTVSLSTGKPRGYPVAT